jgi:8-oxo-dGTP diphosphatase
MARFVHKQLLRVFARLPQRCQVAVVHSVSPLYSVGSIVVLRDDGGAVLLVRQAYKERWGLPGGISRRGEEPYDTAKREVMEETGLRIEPIGEPFVDVGVTMRKVDVIYAARLCPGVTATQAKAKLPEILECRWFPADALPALQEEAVTGILRFPWPVDGAES